MEGVRRGVWWNGGSRRGGECIYFFFFFFNDTATTEIYTLSLHDALPIWLSLDCVVADLGPDVFETGQAYVALSRARSLEGLRSEEHTSELQSLTNLVCRLLLEKKKKKNIKYNLL